MNYWNLKLSILRLPEYVSAEPIARATWGTVMVYCLTMENGGRITGARAWSDRVWMSGCLATREEVDASAPLLVWEGDDLVVWNYPQAMEDQAKEYRALGSQTSARKAEAARENGKKGGRPRREPSAEEAKRPAPRALEGGGAGEACDR